jgi:hypothetical protein
MTTKEISDIIKMYYKNSIERGALLNDFVFSSKDNNLIFFVEMHQLDSVNNFSEYKEYFTYSPLKKLYIKVNNLDQVKEILTELNALKQDTENILYKISYKNKIDKDCPFYLVINVFKTLGV